MPSRFLVALPKADVPDDQLPIPATSPPTLSNEDRNDASDEILPPTSPDKSHADPEVEVDVDADKENIPPSPVETGLESSLLLTAPLTCDEALSKTIATPCLAMEFEQLGFSSDDDDDDMRSDSEGEDDETSSGGEEDETPVERPPQVLPAILGHKERLTLKRCLSACKYRLSSFFATLIHHLLTMGFLRFCSFPATLSSGTDYTSEFGLSRCNSPTRSVMRLRRSAGSTLSRIAGRRSEG